MKKDGFVFLEVIFGIFILGIISIVCLNLLNFSSIYFQIAEEKLEIDYIAESVFENLKSKDQDNIDFLNSLSLSEGLDYPISEEFKDDYTSKVVLTEDNDYLWCLKLVVYKKTDKERTIYEEFQSSIPK